MTELPGFIEILKGVGTPGLLFGLLYLFMKLDEKKWTAQRADDNDKWKNMSEQMKEMVTQVLLNHKEERNRDFQHLQEQMEYLHGQHQALSMMSSAVGNVQSIVMDLKKDVDQIPTYVRELHGRLDKLYALQAGDEMKKEKH